MVAAREMIEAGVREYTEEIQKLKERCTRLAADLAQRDARIAVLETDLTVARANLAALHQDVTFEADFLVDVEDTEEV